MSTAGTVSYEDSLRYTDRDSITSDYRTNTPVSSRENSPFPRNPDFPKSASYTYLPEAKDSAYNSTASLPITIKGSVSEDDFETPLDSLDVTPPDSSGHTTPSDEPNVSTDPVRHEKGPRVTVLPAVTVTHQETDGQPQVVGWDAGLNPAAKNTEGLKPSKSFARRLSRKIAQVPSRSRTPSPTKSIHISSSNDVDAEGAPVDFTYRSGLSETRSRKSFLKRRDTTTTTTTTTITGDTSTAVGQPSRRGTLKRRLTLTGKTPSATGDSRNVIPNVPPLPKSFSTDRLPSELKSQQHDAPASVPRVVSGDRVPSLGPLALTRKRDELWTIFRNLDADFAKFSSKSTALKANVVRQSLIPFLRNYADHPSNRSLRAEDLDRRTNILNKWWVGLLDILHGKNNQSLSGTDRPAILDALSGLMERVEWRQAPSIFAPLSDRASSANCDMSRTKSSTSVASVGAEFLAESVHHNVRNLLVQNLHAQMAFVVEKMSLRSASASLVTFCGKATAYAFFFCPGIADILVRLWGTTADTMKRVLSENGIGKFDNLREVAANIASVFPPAVQPLGFISLSNMMRNLRKQQPAPLGTADMHWYGYWLERWLGRESDLFYVFVKHYHILAMDYLPTDATKKERMCAPGMLLVHSQILINLDLTIHRDEAPSDGASHSPPTFDDLLGESDAAVSTLPLLPPNATRIMAENRLIMLIRDFLSERVADYPVARHVFAVAFNDLLHAAARKTSIFSHAACYTLCDFLEEALLILVRYEHLHTSQGSVVDSVFWRDVCRAMLKSENTLTEIRLYAFLYTVWGIVCSDQRRKADLCLGLLLDDEVFDRTFNHWCPMVRAYYMRLLCWRVGRYDGEATELDTRIFEKLFELLRKEWSSFLYIREDAERRRVAPPSTAPSNPAPGRRLLIIRTDTQVAPGGSFLAFNGIIPPSPATPLETPATNVRRMSTLSTVSNDDFRPVSRQSTESGNELDVERESGLRSFLRGIMGGSAKKKNQSRNSSRPTSARGSPTPTPPNGLARSATDDPNVPRNRQTSLKMVTPPPVAKYRNFCFKFSLEFSHKLATSPPVNVRLFAPRLPLPAQQYLHQLAPGIPAVRAREPQGESKARTKYVGRALAEWSLIVGEYQGFFERRKGEGIPEDKFVETPTLGVEVFRRSA